MKMNEKQTFLTLFNEFKKEAEPLLAKLSELRKSTIFPLLFHLQASIAPWCVSKVYDAIRKLNEKEREIVDVIIFSTGGDADAAYHIGRMLHRSVKGELTFIVPRLAVSAATLLTFSGNKILMSSPSELGPIDPQIEVSPGRYVSARSLQEVVELIVNKIVLAEKISKSTVEAFIERLPLLEVVDYQRLLNHTKTLAIDLLKLRMINDEEVAKAIAEAFVKKFEYHGKSITIDECIKLGLKVEELSGEELAVTWEFSKLWEELAMIRAKSGSRIVAMELGKGLAFIPSEIEKERENEESSINMIVDKLIKQT
jgi:ATP-dependent protease ClpP protease subunit